MIKVNPPIIEFENDTLMIYAWAEATNIEHENPYHLEGKISTHIHMVLDEIKQYNPSNELLIAAMFHDIGKYVVKKYSEEKGWFVYHGHEKISEEMFRDIYYQYNIDKQSENINLEHVCYLIRNHHKISNLKEYIKKPRRKKSMAILDSPYLSELILLRKCDGLGRIPPYKNGVNYENK